MRRVIPILFLGVYLFSTTDAYQILKVPVIFEHYHEHSLADKNLSFIAFLVMHYSANDPEDGDYQRDMKLPFKTSNHIVRAVIPLMVPEAFNQLQLPAFRRNQPLYLVRNDNLVPSRSVATIFQPPRIT
jgi:hypothetical protein